MKTEEVMKKKILILGDGLLAKELIKQTGWDYVSRKKDGVDITDPSTYYKMTEIFDSMGQSMPYDTIVNCIAYTDTYGTDKETAWDCNYRGVSSLVEFCNKWNTKLVHISTDFLYANSKVGATEEDVPVHGANWYSYTKLLGDGHVQLKSDNYLLLRGTHKETPFTHDKAWINQIGNFDYVNVISSIICSLISNQASGIYNIGTEPKTMFELAKRTKPNVQPTYELYHETTATNVVISVDKTKQFLNKNGVKAW